MFQSFQALYNTQINISKRRPSCFCMAEVSITKVSIAEVSITEVSLAKVSTTQVGTKPGGHLGDSQEVGTTEVGTTEVGTTEVGTIEVWTYLWMLLSPIVPYIYTLAEYIDMFLICHFCNPH